MCFYWQSVVFCLSTYFFSLQLYKLSFLTTCQLMACKEKQTPEVQEYIGGALMLAILRQLLSVELL